MSQNSIKKVLKKSIQTLRDKCLYLFYFALIISIIPDISPCQTIDISNDYAIPLSVSVGTTSPQTPWQSINSNMTAKCNYNITKANYKNTFIYFTYDLESFKLFILKQENKLQRKEAWANFSEWWIDNSNCEGKTEADRLICLENSIKAIKQMQKEVPALQLMERYIDLYKTMENEEKKECLKYAIAFIEKAYKVGFPSVATEIEGYVSNVLAKTTFNMPISKQIEMVKILKNQIELGTYWSKYKLNGIESEIKYASGNNVLPFSIRFNQYFNNPKAIWPNKYLFLGYAQSQLMHNLNYDTIINSNRAINYNHLSLGVGLLPGANSFMYKNSKAIGTFYFELSYRLNFRNDFKIAIPDSSSNTLEKVSINSGKLESSDLCLGFGTAFGYNGFLIKLIAQTAPSIKLHEKGYTNRILKCSFVSISISVPLVRNVIFKYKR